MSKQTSSVAAPGRSILGAVVVLMFGTLLSRVLALVREQVIANRFGTDAALSLFTVLSAIPTQIYDLLVGGLISAALIPVFSEYIERDPAEFWEIINTVTTVVLVALGSVALLVGLLPQLFSTLLARDLFRQQPALLAQAVPILRLMVIAVIFMGLRGLAEAILQSQRRFTLPALTSSVFNIGIILAALVLARWGVLALAAGMTLGALTQVLLLAPAIRLTAFRPRLNLRHPAVRRIALLYVPVAIGTGFSLIGTVVDRSLATSVGESAAAIMRYATTLIQFLLGLIASAVGLAILPTLSRLSSAEDENGFRQMFGMGIKVVLMLMVPAAVLLGVLALPTIRLLFEHGKFTASDTAITRVALLLYLPSLIVAAIDQLLIFAFYARRNTLTPNLVQGVAISTYLVVAFASYRSWGMYGLIIANVAQHTAHVLIMLWLAQRRLGLLRGQRFGEAVWKVATASGLSGALAWAIAMLGPLQRSAVLQLLVAGSLGGLVYLVLLRLLCLEAFSFFQTTLTQRLRRRTGD